ncbi:MAG: helix-turn-helix transcriptional regulator [Ruminococcus sp.]|nr:helix-turn-helix transcriptional regulator [Candidatus Copronaster equi]
MDFAKNFKQARLNAGLSQKQIADKLNVDRSTIAQYERGISTPNLKNLPKICEILNVKTDELLK